MNEYKQMIGRWIYASSSKHKRYHNNKNEPLSCCRKTLYNLMNGKTEVNGATLQQLASDFKLEYQDEIEDFDYLKETAKQCIQSLCDVDNDSLVSIRKHFNVRLYRRFILLNDYALLIQSFLEFTENADLTYYRHYALLDKERSIFADDLLPLADFMAFYDALYNRDFPKAQAILANGTLPQREQMLCLILGNSRPLRTFYKQKLHTELNKASEPIALFYRSVCSRLLTNNKESEKETNVCSLEKISRCHKRRMRRLAQTADNDASLKEVLAYARLSRQYKVVYDYILACREADEADGNY